MVSTHEHDDADSSAAEGPANGTSRFDERAATWDQDPDKVAHAEAIADAIIATAALGPQVRVLDYGAGTGLVAQRLSEHVGSVTLADSSRGMREVIQAKIDAGALTDAQLWALDLEYDPAPDEQFDLVITALVLHHVRDLARVLSAFAELMAPGGQLCIADLDAEDGSFHDHDFDGHHGFDRDTLASDLRTAGFAGVDVTDCTEIIREGSPYQVFLATATR